MEVLSKPDAIDDAMELRITALPLLNCTQSVTVLLLRYGARSSLKKRGEFGWKRQGNRIRRLSTQRWMLRTCGTPSL